MPSQRRLSSLITPLLKFVFAPIWILGFGAGVAIMWVDPQGLVAASSNATLEQWWMTALFVAGTNFLYWSGVSAKRVALTESGLLVSNFLVAEAIPFSGIAEVSQFTWAYPRMITIRFTRPTRFGASIRFLPRLTFLGTPFADDAVVDELRALNRQGSP